MNKIGLSKYNIITGGAIVLSLLMLGIIIYLGCFNHPTEDIGKDLKVNLNHIENILFSLFASVAFALADTFVSRNLSIGKSLSYAGLFFSLAMLSWGIIHFLELCMINYEEAFSSLIEFDKGKDEIHLNKNEKGTLLNSWFSTINSILLLTGFAHIELYKNKFSLDLPWRLIQVNSANSIKSSGIPYNWVYLILIGIGLLVMIIDSNWGSYSADVFLSFFTGIILCYGLSIAYWQRGAKHFTWLAICTFLAIFFAHIGNWAEWYQNDYIRLFTNVFKIYLVFLLFALHITHLKEKKNEELEARGQIVDGFIELIGPNISKSSPKKVLDFVFRKLKAYDIYDYGFCIAVKDDGKMLFPHYYEDDIYRSTTIGVAIEENPFALQCINGEKDVLIQENLPKRKNRNNAIFPDAGSLLYIKLRNNGKAFGAMSLQSRAIQISLSTQQWAILHALAFLISNTITPESVIKPIEKLLDTIINLDDSDMHNDIRPQYEALASFLGWEEKKLLSKFIAEEKDLYHKHAADHILNQVLKDINRRKLTLRCITLISIAAFENQIKAKKLSSFIKNPFLEMFQNYISEWLVKGDTSQTLIMKEGIDIPEYKYEYAIEVLYDLMCKIIVHLERPATTIIEQGVTLNIHEKSILVSLDLISPDNLIENIEENKRNFAIKGELGLKHDVSRRLFLLQYWTNNAIKIYLKLNEDGTKTPVLEFSCKA